MPALASKCLPAIWLPVRQTCSLQTSFVAGTTINNTFKPSEFERPYRESGKGVSAYWTDINVSQVSVPSVLK